jgi:hypothetical protein
MFLRSPGPHPLSRPLACSARTALAPLRRLDIVWLAGETSAFSWFVPLLQRFETEASADAELRAMLHVNVFLTGVPADTDEATVLLHFALDAFFAGDERDCVSIAVVHWLYQ